MTNLAFNFDGPPPLPVETAQRISDARSSGRLSDCEEDVLALLVDLPSGARAGRDKAMQISEMQSVWARRQVHIWPDRSIKDAVKQLLEVHECPIGSSRTPGRAGYFVCASDEDLQASERPLRGELISIAKRLRALNPKSNFARALLGQLQIEGEL